MTSGAHEPPTDPFTPLLNHFINKLNIFNNMYKQKIALLSALLFFVSVVFASGQTLRLKNVTVSKAMTELQAKTGYHFVYESSDLDVNHHVNVNGNDIRQLVGQILKGQNVTYDIQGKNIVVSGKSSARVSSATPPIQQQDGKHKITGTVLDSNGDPVIGATVLEKGTNNGTVTNLDGRFTLDVSPRAMLQVSYIGYVTQSVRPTGGNTVVTLEQDNAQLDELVVVGYGTQKRSDLTGAISGVTSKDFEKQPIMNATDALMGRLSGVSVTNTSGNVNGDVKIRIRGANSINGGNDPLYVVDGLVGADMPPVDDIESIEVLKDASSTAIYGSRGANGVVLITTHSGKEGKTTVKFNAFLSNLHAAKTYDTLSPYDYAQELNVLYNNIYTADDLEAFRNGSRGTDWQKELLQSAWAQKYNVSVDGGTNKAQYHVFLEYSDNKSLIKNAKTEGYTLRSNFNMQLYKNLNFKLYVNGYYNNLYNTNSSAYEGGSTGLLFNAVTWGPTEPVYASDGSYNFNDNWGAMGLNPVMRMNEHDTWRKNFGFNANGVLTWQVLPSLSLQYSLNVTLSNSNNYEWENSTYTQSSADAVGERGLSKYIYQNFIATWNQSYGQHNITLTGVAETTKSTNDALRATAEKLSNETLGYWGMALGGTQTVGTGWSDWSLVSFVGRANYNYANKYYGSFAFRADGSSKFASGNKWSYFPSASLAWRASEEEFVKNWNVFSNLKFRMSYGVTGNQGVGPYSTIASLYPYNPKLYGTNTRVLGYTARIVNKNLKWERTGQFDFGIDAGFFDNRLNVSLDYYRKDTRDLLLTVTTPYFLGGDSMYDNVGKVRNRGFEATINAVPIQTKDWYWDVSANFSYNKNKIVNLGGEIIYGLSSSGNNDAVLSNETYILKEGLPLGELYGYKCLGIWQTDEAEQAAKYGCKPGDYKYADLDDNGTIDASDRTNIGNGTPKYFWGLNSTLRYKNWDLNVLIQGVHGADKLNVLYAMGTSIHSKSRTITIKDGWVNRWTASNPSNRWPNIESTTSTNYINSSQWLQDASFVRLKNLSLGYTFDRKLTHFADIRLYVSGQNLFTITSYKGYDPEASSTLTSDVATGIDTGITPTARVFTFGAQLTF